MNGEQKIKVVLVGIGGYGANYPHELLPKLDSLPVEVVAGVDPMPQSSSAYNLFVEKNIPLYSSVEEFYAEHTADLAIIATPIQFHTFHMSYCMEHGSHVLCEKPVCSTIDDVQKLIEVRDRTGKQAAIGYQWSYSEAILNLKEDILNGKFGKPVRLKSIVLWPRDFAYYARGCGWAGKKKDQQGRWVLDSVAANATAHYLHNMLFVTGKAIDQSVQLDSIIAETYRANNIENFDTCALRAKTVDGIDLLFIASHAIQRKEVRNPELEYVFEKGVIRSFRDKDYNDHLYAEMKDGQRIEYGDPGAQIMRKMYWMFDVIRGKKQVVCGLETASAHTKCINAIAEMIPVTPVFPEELVVTDEVEKMVYVKGLADVLNDCYEQWKLPGEYGTSWARELYTPEKTKDLKGYNHFAG